MLARYVMRLLCCDCTDWNIKYPDCNRLLSDLGLFKRRLQYDRCHPCEERPGSDSGKSCFLLLFIIFMTLC